jgi:gag-polypeptide of LTR copia-type
MNFLTWRSQIEPIVNDYGLTKHLDSSVAAPPRQITIDTQSTSNPDFHTWYMQDRLLLGWLRLIISAVVLSQHVQCQTIAALWSALHRIYSAVSSVKIMELRRLLQTTTRGGQGCNEYFERMRNIVDQLAAIRESITDPDLIRYILNGLGSEYNSFVVALTTRSDLVSLEDLHGFFLSHELLLLSQHQLSSSSDSVAFYASSRGRGRYFKNCG